MRDPVISSIHRGKNRQRKNASVRPPAYRLVEVSDVKRFVQKAIEREQLRL